MKPKGRKKPSLEEAADQLAGLLEKELEGLPAYEIKRRSEFAHKRLVARMAKRRVQNDTASRVGQPENTVPARLVARGRR